MCHIGTFLVIRTINKKSIDICCDLKENTQFSKVEDAAALANTLVANAKLGEDYLVVKVVA